MKMLFACLLLVFSTACRFGSADFEGEVNGHDFEANGTVFSFEDRTDAQGLERDVPILRVVMMYTSVDPSSDLSQMSGDALDRLIHENSQRESLSFSVRDPNQLLLGEALEQERVGGMISGDNVFSALATFRPETLDDNSTYADFIPYGTREVIRFSPTLLEDDQTLSGDVSIDISRREGDVSNARSAMITGDFSAPRVSEALAEKNLRTLRWPAFLSQSFVEESP